jgi:hypothetical protein
MLSNEQGYSLLRLLTLFMMAVLIGNGFSFFINCLKVTASYQQTKKNYNLFKSIPAPIIEAYSLQVRPKNDISKNNLLEVYIHGMVDKARLIIETYDKKEVCITIINHLETLPNFQKRRLEIEKRYRDQQITLTGWGLRSVVSQQEWKTMTKEDIEGIIRSLFRISDAEALNY